MTRRAVNWHFWGTHYRRILALANSTVGHNKTHETLQGCDLFCTMSLLHAESFPARRESVLFELLPEILKPLEIAPTADGDKYSRVSPSSGRIATLSDFA